MVVIGSAQAGSLDWMDKSTSAHIGAGYLVQDIFSDCTKSDGMGLGFAVLSGFFNEYYELKAHRPKHFAAVAGGALLSFGVNTIFNKKKRRHPIGWYDERGTP